MSPQHIDNSPPDEDGDTDQTPLTLEKIEAKANEVWIYICVRLRISLFFQWIFHYIGEENDKRKQSKAAFTKEERFTTGLVYNAGIVRP